MKLSRFQINKFLINIFFLSFLLNFNIHSQDNQDIIMIQLDEPVEVIYEFFATNQSQIYFVSTRQFFLDSIFGDIFIDGDYKENYTDLTFFVPFGKETGLVIQYDQEKILDAFLFVYGPKVHRFVSKYNPPGGFLSHRFEILREFGRTRFTVNSVEMINAILLPFNIKIE